MIFRLRALTMCQECHVRYHTGEGGYKHVTQNLFPNPWTLEGPDQAYPTEAVIRLLGEAQPCQTTRNEAMGWVIQLCQDINIIVMNVVPYY